jgi:hypothetical protein
VFDGLKNAISVVIGAIIEFWVAFVDFLTYVWETWGNDIMAFADRLFQQIGRIFSRAGSFLTNVFGALSEALQGNWGRMWQRIQNMLLDAVLLIIDGASFLIEELLGIVDWGLSALGVDSGLADGFGGFVDATRDYLEGLKYEFETTTEAGENMFGALSSGFSKLFAGGGSAATAPTMGGEETNTQLSGAETPALWERGLVGMENMPEVPPPDTGAWSSWANGFRDMLGNITTFTDTLTQSAEAMGTAFGEGFRAMITGADDAKEQMKRGLKTIVDTTFAAATAHAIEAAVGAGKYSGPAAPIVIPALIAAGMAMVRGAFGAVTGFADGGIVSGPTMGLVAEYPGARTNPEVIAPLDKLQSMIGGQTTNVVGTIKGRDLVLANQRGGYSRRRAFG